TRDVKSDRILAIVSLKGEEGTRLVSPSEQDWSTSMQINEPGITAAARGAKHPSKPTSPATPPPTDKVELTGGNKVVPLIGGDQIFPAAEAAIKGAKSSVQLEMYRLGYDKM